MAMLPSHEHEYSPINTPVQNMIIDTLRNSVPVFIDLNSVPDFERTDMDVYIYQTDINDSCTLFITVTKRNPATIRLGVIHYPSMERKLYVRSEPPAQQQTPDVWRVDGFIVTTSNDFVVITNGQQAQERRHRALGGATDDVSIRF